MTILTIITSILLLCTAPAAADNGTSDNTYYYGLYRDLRESDPAAAAGYAERYLSGTALPAADTCAAEACVFLSDWYGYDNFLYSKGIQWRQQALSCYRLLGDRRNCAETDFQLAVLYLELEQYHKTLTHTTDAIRYFESSDTDIDRTLQCWNLLGIVYSICEDEQKSREYFGKYLEGARRAKDSLSIVNALHNLAIAFPQDSILTSSLADESVRLCEKTADTAKLCRLHLSLSSECLADGNIAKSSEHLARALPLLRNADDSGRYLLNRALVLHEQGQPDSAVSCARRALGCFSKGEFSSARKICYGLLSDILSGQGDWQAAYMAQKEYLDIEKAGNSDKVFLELFKAENSIRALNEQERLRERRLRTVTAATAAAFLLLTALLTAVYLIKRKALILKQQQSELAGRNEILELRRLQQYNIDRITDEIVDKLSGLGSQIKDIPTRNKISGICTELINARDNEQWKSMSTLVPEFNSSFFKNLLKEYPDLTVNERRLCALLNLNLSTKEISEITRQSPHSINVARSRLRTKLGIGTSTSLQEFLSKFNEDTTR